MNTPPPQKETNPELNIDMVDNKSVSDFKPSDVSIIKKPTRRLQIEAMLEQAEID